MYNGIGLATTRGSGTNGYVQRNFAVVKGKKQKIDYKTEDDFKRLDAAAHKKPNQEILEHNRKRKLEVKCVELEELMEEQGNYSKEDIELRVSEFRQMLMDKNDDVDDEPIMRETHQIAHANQERNEKLRAAFGISLYFVEGSSLDPNRKEKEKAAAQINANEYAILSDSSSSVEPEAVKRQEKKRNFDSKKKKHQRHRSKSSSTDGDETKKKKSKKNQRERSESSSTDEDETKKKKSKKHRKERLESTSPDKTKKKKSKKRRKERLESTLPDYQKKKSKKHRRERSESISPPSNKKEKDREHRSHSRIRRDTEKKTYGNSDFDDLSSLE
uniref:CWF21 domain-containing protein n=1 Tax=Strigamia maritima TaxID=126957 RepID=T1J330_STRMM